MEQTSIWRVVLRELQATIIVIASTVVMLTAVAIALGRPEADLRRHPTVNSIALAVIQGKGLRRKRVRATMPA